MAKVTITLTDTSAPTGTYSMEFNVDGSRIAEGQLTAAHLVGAYIFRELCSGTFVTMSDQYAEKKGVTVSSARDEDAAIVTMSFTDTDIDAGLYKIDTNVERSDDAMFYTSSLLIAEFVLAHVQTSAFLDSMWKYADAVVAEGDQMSIVNDNRGITPQSSNDDDSDLAVINHS